MKYHAVLTANQGLNTPSTNPCQLLDFGFLKLAAGETYRAGTPGRELLAVILGGRATFEIDGHCFEKVGGRPNVFAGKPHSVYIPAGAQFSIHADSAVEIALPSAPSDLPLDPYVITPGQVATGVWGAANFKRNFVQILTLASQPDLPARRLIVGETFTPSGNWSTFPPHKHQEDNLPREAYHEEMYYFRVSPADGFGICHYYNEEGEEENFTVRDNSIHMMPRGYHTVVSAPGYTTYYLWFLAGNQRVQGAVEDAQLSWVSRTVAMLKELGHEEMANVLDLFKLDGKVALVTGAGQGLGQGMAIALAEAGADIVGLDRGSSDATGEAVCAVGRRYLPEICDLHDASVDRLNEVAARVVAQMGSLDILVNNAGIIRRAPALEFSEADWDDVLQINLKAAFFLSQAAGRVMVSQGRGKIINVASMLSFQGGIIVPSYTAAKSGIAGITRALANEWARYGVNVNALAPGYMATENTAPLRANAERAPAILERIPAGRWGTPDDLRGAVVFLASAASDYLYGAIIPVDGGWLTR